MLSNACRYAIRAVIYIASRHNKDEKTGLIRISEDLGLPAPFLGKILQQLARNKILNSLKGPHGGFSLICKPEEITLYEIVVTIDGDGIFTDCIIHNTKCRQVSKEKKECPVHDEYSAVRAEIIKLFRKTTIADLVKKAVDINKIFI